MNRFSYIVFSLLLLLFDVSTSQPLYPADTLYSSSRTSLGEKMLIAPIALWQRLSYNVPLIRCQFYPSCSNYAAQSISEHGIFLGTAMAADRIIRCNPFAYHYHLRDRDPNMDLSSVFHLDGRLVNPVPKSPIMKRHNGKSPILAASISVILPGAGRVYAGRIGDGLFGFLTFALTANAAYMHFQNGSNIRFGIFSLGTFILYGGEIYGAYRAASLAPVNPVK